MQNAECRIGPKAVNCARCRMQMQNAECRIGPKAVHCTRCRMQMQNAECRSGPKAGCLSTRCRMQDADAGCGIGLKAVSCTRRTNSLGLILHPAFCILHPAPCRRIHFGADSASCILHSACCTYRVNILGWVLHSAFCICILHFQRNTECRISPSMQRQIHAVCMLHATRVRSPPLRSLCRVLCGCVVGD